jgi:type I restriction enzyme M protein
MFHGFDFDATMLRIASMNLMLHGVDNPDIHYQDISNSSEVLKQAGGFDVIPPTRRSRAASTKDVHPRSRKVNQEDGAALPGPDAAMPAGGRRAVIVPDVLFGSSARTRGAAAVVEDNQLEASNCRPVCSAVRRRARRS